MLENPKWASGDFRSVTPDDDDDGCDGDGNGDGDGDIAGDDDDAFFKPQGLKLTFNLSASVSVSARMQAPILRIRV